VWQKVKKRDWRFFIQGIDTVLYSAALTNFVYFGVYEGLNQLFHPTHGHFHVPQYAWLLPTVNSFLAELSSFVVYIPIDCVRTRIQSNSRKFRYRSTWHGLRTITRKEGFRRLFTGSHVYMMHNLLFTPILFTVYEKYKQYVVGGHVQTNSYTCASNPNESEFGLFESLKGTILATTIATIVTNPLNTILVRFQMVNYAQRQYMQERIWYIIKSSYRIRGLKGLNVGLLPHLLGSNVSTCVYIPIYEHFRTQFRSLGEY
jgi:ABC-type phosphate transport system permease subunit